jgi:hypothetical protein
MLVRDIVAAVLDPTALSSFQVSVHLGRPKRWFHPTDEETICLGKVDNIDVNGAGEV